jgi:hypothetical protein
MLVKHTMQHARQPWVRCAIVEGLKREAINARRQRLQEGARDFLVGLKRRLAQR